ncbi:MAG: hypothetical protein AAFZ49_00185 [Cyanobacteria bacterium J06659_2]
MLSTSRLPVLYRYVCFHRAKSGDWVLCGVPHSLFGPICARLFVLGCRFMACGCQLGSPDYCWLSFRAAGSLPMQLARLFPATPSHAPLIFRGSGRLSTTTTGQVPAGGFAQSQFCGFSSQLPG